MTSPANLDPDPFARINDVDRILYEMREAAAEALEDHRRTGDPIAVWRNERVEWIAPEDIPVRKPTPAS